MASPRALLVLCAWLCAAPARADRPRAIDSQAARVPLATSVSAADERAMLGLLRFDHFARAPLLPWRARIEPLATAGDPLAQLWLARLHDLFSFGAGTPEEGRIAMTWYHRAADQHLALAEYFLYRAYSEGLLGTPLDAAQARVFLERAHGDGAGAVKAEAALALARLAIEPAPGGSAPDEAKGLRYLEEALALEPTRQAIVDWLIDIYVTHGDVARATRLAERSTNPPMIHKAAALCLQRKNTTCAIRLLQRAARFPTDNDIPPQALLDLYTRVCRKQLARSRLGAADTPSAWQFFQRWQRGCVVEPGG